MKKAMAELLGSLLLAIPVAAAETAPAAPCPELAAAGAELTFNRHGLYGRIDGGAELFFEFGFQELTVRRFGAGKRVVELEIYRMDCPAAALGIYLTKCGRENPAADLGARHTVNLFQLLAVKGDRYFQVNNFSGDEELAPCLPWLAAQEVGSEPPDAPPEIWDRLPVADLIPGSQRLVRGRFSLEPIFTLGEGDVLQLGGEVFGAVADYRTADGNSCTLIVVLYPDLQRARAAWANLQANLDPYLEVLDQGANGLVFRDYRGRYGKVVLRGRDLSVTVDLPGRPDLPR